MSDTAALYTPARPAFTMPGWGPVAAFLILMTALGPTLGAVSRPLFVLGCAGIGWWSWRRDPAAHLQSALLLFCFAAFLRRIVDLSAGYEPSGLMLIGPLLTILIPVGLAALGLENRDDKPNAQIWPIGFAGAGIAYATALALYQGDWMNAASGAIKWLAPLAYAYMLARAKDPEALIEAAASVFLVALPIMGIYGIIQYVDPPQWDRYWMNLTTILAIGFPIPFGVRTFSTMNGPASFATFAAAGLLLVFFLRPGWRAILLSAPAAMSLLLSTYRTAWISLVIGVVFAAFFRSTRSRAIGTMLSITAALLVAAFLTPFGDMLGTRLASFGQGSDDSSAHERLEEFIQVWNLPDSGFFGTGFTVTDVGSAGAMAMDGMIINCWVSMGMVFGVAYLGALVGTAVIAIRGAWQNSRPAFIVIGALACGGLAQLPLANIAASELGFLFWTFVALIPRQRQSWEVAAR